MKELIRFFAYTGATAAIILFVIFMARFDNESGTFLIAVASVVVIVLPVIVGILMGKREQAKRRESDGHG